MKNLFQGVLEGTTFMSIQYIPYWKTEEGNQKFGLAALPPNFGAQLSCHNTGTLNTG